MIWALLFDSVVVAVLLWRVASLKSALRRLTMTTHDAANRALRRERRDRWRWRETDGLIRRLARESLPYLDVPDLLAGPPDDPDSA